MAQQSPYKRSPLSFNSPRASPFRRPESPSSPSSPSTVRPLTPTSTTPYQPTTPSKLHNASAPVTNTTFSPRQSNRELPPSPTKGPSSNSSDSSSSIMMPSTSSAQSHSPYRTGNSNNTSSGNHPGVVAAAVAAASSSSTTTTYHRPMATAPTTTTSSNLDALSRLPPAQVREMREAFQILDRNSDGFVDRDDISEMLTSLGLEANNSSISPFFPANTPHPLPLPTYLSSLSSLLSSMSPPNELLAALSAFDEDDSGQISVSELVNTVTTTPPGAGNRQLSAKEVNAVLDGFTGRRAFGKYSAHGKGGLGGGDVFRYRDWVAGLGAVGGTNNDQEAAKACA